MTTAEARAEIDRLNEERKLRAQAIRDVRNDEVDAVFVEFRRKAAEYAPLLRDLWAISRGDATEESIP